MSNPKIWKQSEFSMSCGFEDLKRCSIECIPENRVFTQMSLICSQISSPEGSSFSSVLVLSMCFSIDVKDLLWPMSSLSGFSFC